MAGRVLGEPGAEEADEGGIEDGAMGVGICFCEVIGRCDIPEDTSNNFISFPCSNDFDECGPIEAIM